ncbi:hypothetical protein [Nostoc sp. T09]|uniref:hypothetical protein n=1 Tax=Nostoc sp. T09 TaxID=1932621 RepID=UPI0015C4F74E|nr:hypothetical protein [Nostoc sp. T09]
MECKGRISDRLTKSGIRTSISASITNHVMESAKQSDFVAQEFDFNCDRTYLSVVYP